MKAMLASAFASVLALAPAAFAQDGSAFKQLIDELHAKGVLDDATYKKIRDRADSEGGSASAVAGYDPGKGFFLKSADDTSSLHISGFGDFRYTYFDRDEDVPLAGEDKSSFRIRKMRVKFFGTAVKPWVNYFLQWENSGGSLSLLDYYVDVYDKKSMPEIGLKFGQFKPPFSRQFLVSDETLDVTERSISNDFFFFDRDQGVMLHGRPCGDSANVEYWTGLFNGNGRNQSDNPDVGLLWVSRLEWNILGEHGYTEGDPDDTQDPQWSIASSYGYNLVTPQQTLPAVTTDIGISRWEADTAFKLMGFSVQGEVYVSSETPDDRSPGVRGVHSSGTYVQSGFFVMPKELEVAARWAYIDTDNALVPRRQEIAGGVHYYFAGHPWKLQAEIRHLEDVRTPGSDNYETQVIVQMQVSF
ncbi:MAG: hypothetical protein HY292_13130 [Planctomycetes bacterium]|nr:hypothetical protein [Planctomycetota bacterium]